MANKREETFCWQRAASHLCRYTQRRMRLNRGGQPEARAQVKGPQVKYICMRGVKIPPLELANKAGQARQRNMNYPLSRYKRTTWGKMADSLKWSWPQNWKGSIMSSMAAGLIQTQRSVLLKIVPQLLLSDSVCVLADGSRSMLYVCKKQVNFIPGTCPKYFFDYLSHQII